MDGFMNKAVLVLSHLSLIGVFLILLYAVLFLFTRKKFDKVLKAGCVCTVLYSLVIVVGALFGLA